VAEQPSSNQPQTRSVKIGEDERTGWSSERPRRDGAPARPPDISVRCQVLTPADELRYSPGSMLMIVSGSAGERDRFAERLIDDKALLSLGKVRALLAGRVAEEEMESRSQEVIDAAMRKRLEANQTVVIAAEGLDADERERYARLAAASRRPRHLILLEAPREDVPEDAHAALNDLRRRLDAGELGAEGFHTALRMAGAAVGELKRVVFQHPPKDE
jgi:predicted kinase